MSGARRVLQRERQWWRREWGRGPLRGRRNRRVRPIVLEVLSGVLCRVCLVCRQIVVE